MNGTNTGTEGPRMPRGSTRTELLWRLAERIEQEAGEADGREPQEAPADGWKPREEERRILALTGTGNAETIRGWTEGRWKKAWFRGAGAAHAVNGAAADAEYARPAGRRDAARVLRWLTRFRQLPEGSCGSCGADGPADRLWWWMLGKEPVRKRNGRRGGARALVCRSCSARIRDWATVTGLEQTTRNQVGETGYVGFGARREGLESVDELRQRLRRMERRLRHAERENRRLRRRAAAGRAGPEETGSGGKVAVATPAAQRAVLSEVAMLKEREAERLRRRAEGYDRALRIGEPDDEPEEEHAGTAGKPAEGQGRS